MIFFDLSLPHSINRSTVRMEVLRNLAASALVANPETGHGSARVGAAVFELCFAIRFMVFVLLRLFTTGCDRRNLSDFLGLPRKICRGRRAGKTGCSHTVPTVRPQSTCSAPTKISGKILVCSIATVPPKRKAPAKRGLLVDLLAKRQTDSVTSHGDCCWELSTCRELACRGVHCRISFGLRIRRLGVRLPPGALGYSVGFCVFAGAGFLVLLAVLLARGCPLD